MPDPAAVDAAVLAVLAGDATLAGLLPDGVYFDVAAPRAQAFVVLRLIDHADEPMLDGGTAYEVHTYRVEAVAPETSGVDINTAAQQIYTLLQNAVLVPDGYADMRCQRLRRVRDTVVDEVTNTRWQHRGGDYEVWVTAAD